MHYSLIVRGQRLTRTIVDRVLESCFQLLSLFFMTIGRNNEAPAAYALTSTIKRLLDHLTEVDLYSAKDLESISHTLTKLGQNVKATEPEYSPYIITLLSNRLELCEKSLAHLKKRLDRLEDPLPKTYEKLISILRSMSLANTRSKVCCGTQRDQWNTISDFVAVLAVGSPEATSSATRNRREEEGWQDSNCGWKDSGRKR